MRRAVTAVYRSFDAATLARSELERLGTGRRHVTILPDDEGGTTSAAAGSAQPADTPPPPLGTMGSAYVGMPPGAYVGMMPDYDVAAAAYLYADTPHGDAFDQLHDLHLPEADTRIYQQAIRNGDTIISVEVDDGADLARIQEIMRRSEDGYDLDDLDTRYDSAEYVSRRQPLRGVTTRA